MKFRLQILPTAERELQRQHDYISGRSRRGANAWANAFFKALKKLQSKPHSQPVAPESEDHTVEIRQLLFKTRKGLTYRALFTIRDQDVYILHIRGSGQEIMTADEIVLP